MRMNDVYSRRLERLLHRLLLDFWLKNHYNGNLAFKANRKDLNRTKLYRWWRINDIKENIYLSCPLLQSVTEIWLNLNLLS